MNLQPIDFDITKYPPEFKSFLEGAKLYDSSSSPNARVVFVDKENGYFIKSASAGTTLHGESYMTEYFYGKGLAPKLVSFIPNYNGSEFMLTEKVPGEDCLTQKYILQPEKLCDLIAERLAFLHALDCSDCLVRHNNGYIERAKTNYALGKYDRDLFPDNWGYKSAEDAIKVIEERAHLFRPNTLIHGDYCLPNIILNDWSFSGFIDLDSAGVSERHIDVFWGAWSLFFNLKTDQYRQRFIDAYEANGGEKVDEDILKLVAACEVFAD